MTSQDVRDRTARASADDVATAIQGCDTIGRAFESLSNAGWHTVIAGNRITVDDRISLRFIGERRHDDGRRDADWMVSEIGGGPLVRIISVTNSSAQ